MTELYHDQDGSLTEAQGFDYDAVDREVFGIATEREDVEKVLAGVRDMLAWICQGNNDRARSVRLQAVRYYIPDKAKNQGQLAREIGVTKAAVNQKVCELRDWLETRSGHDVKPRGARSTDAREKFSDICKSNHQRRKVESTKSPTKSGRVSPTPYDLVRRSLQEAKRCAQQQSDVAQHLNAQNPP